MSQFSKYIGIIVLFGLLASCAKGLTDVSEDRLPKKKDSELKESLDSLSSIKFDYFYAKIATKYKDSAQNRSFKTSIRIKKDSAFNATITFANIPGFNSLVTKDSLKFYIKPDKCYTIESLEYIQDQFGIDFSYENLEELFFGMPVGFVSSQKYFRVQDPFAYTLGSHRKRDIKKNERKDTREIITFYTLGDDLTTLKSIRIESPQDSASVDIDYRLIEPIDGYLVPMNIEVKITTPRQEIAIGLDYKKARVNEEEQIHFVIPEDYEKCK